MRYCVDNAINENEPSSHFMVVNMLIKRQIFGKSIRADTRDRVPQHQYQYKRAIKI